MDDDQFEEPEEPEDEEPEEPEDEEEPSEEEKQAREDELAHRRWHREIDERLDQVRPARASLADDAWMKPVDKWADENQPQRRIAARLRARDVVRRRNRHALTRTRNVLRKWALGQAPLSFTIDGAAPIKVGDEHVRLDAATPRDMDISAKEVKEKANSDHQRTLLGAQAQMDLARMAREAGHAVVRLLGDQPPREQPEQDAS